MTITTTVSLREAGEKLPGGTGCISPSVDLEMTGASMADNAGSIR